MQGHIKIISPCLPDVRDLVAECFDGYQIPSQVDGMVTVWIGHVIQGFVMSAGALTFYRDQPEFAGLHTGCVHPDFRGHGFHIELIRERVAMAVGLASPK